MTTQARNIKKVGYIEHTLPKFLFDYRFAGGVLLFRKRFV